MAKEVLQNDLEPAHVPVLQGSTWTCDITIRLSGQRNQDWASCGQNWTDEVEDIVCCRLNPEYALQHCRLDVRFDSESLAPGQNLRINAHWMLSSATVCLLEPTSSNTAMVLLELGTC